MANPQFENGFIKVANEIMEALAKTRIPGEARQIIDTVLRKTYGFQKKEDSISLSQFCFYTGLKKPTCCRAINKAIVMNIIIKKDNGNTSSYSFNKNFDTWKPLSKKITVIKKDNKSLSKKIHTKEIYTKENNINKTLKSDFHSVIQDISFIQTLGNIYQDVNIQAEIQHMKAWLNVNRPKKDYYRFITNWIKNAADKKRADTVKGIRNNHQIENMIETISNGLDGNI